MSKVNFNFGCYKGNKQSFLTANCVQKFYLWVNSLNKPFKILLFLTLFVNFCRAQGGSQDSIPYKALLKEYEICKDSDRKKAFQIADQLEKLSLEKNNLFFLSDAYCKKAINYYFDNNYDSSRICISKCLNVAKQSDNYKSEMKAYNLLGAICYNQGDFKNTEKNYFEKIKVAEKYNDTASIYGTYYNLGLLFYQEGNYLKSADYNFKALDYFKRIKDTFNILSSLHAIGFTYVNLGDITTALTYYRSSLNFLKTYKHNYELAGLYIDMASIFGKQNKADSALYFLDLALRLSAKEKDDFHFAIATNSKASFYMAKKNYSQALLLALEAEKINLRVDRKIALCEVYTNIADIYYHQKRIDSSLKYGYKAYNIGSVINKAELLHRCTKVLSLAYEGKKNADSALKFYKLYSAFNDSLKKEDQLRGIGQTEFFYEKQRQETKRGEERLVAQTKLEKQKQINLIVLIASVLLLIFLIVGIINYRQKQKANAEVLIQKKLLEEKNKEVADSINYASRIQKSIMPDAAGIKEILSDCFVLYLPKDVVSGDFYWINSVQTRSNQTVKVMAVADCTGHGVPGAFMSLIGATILNQSLSVDEITNPAQALDFINKELPKNIKGSTSSGTIKDGMEICMCGIDYTKMELQFSGANNNLYLVRNNELILIRGDKRPIGGGYQNEGEKFTNHVIPLLKKDVIYMSTDGFPDQFGGPKGKKFKYKQMEELFLAVHHLPVSEQSEIMNKRFLEWKGTLDQVDDVLVMGIKI